MSAYWHLPYRACLRARCHRGVIASAITKKRAKYPRGSSRREGVLDGRYRGVSGGDKANRRKRQQQRLNNNLAPRARRIDVMAKRRRCRRGGALAQSRAPIRVGTGSIEAAALRYYRPPRRCENAANQARSERSSISERRATNRWSSKRKRISGIGGLVYKT